MANRLTLDGSPVAQYGVDDAGRLTTITHGSSTFSLAYDNASRRLSLSYPNGIVTSYSYDANSSLIGITSQRGGSPVQQISYTYDTVGNRTAKTVDSLLETYSYDPLSRLTGVARAGATPRRWSLAYDSVGNRLSGQADGITLSGDFDQNNQLLSLTPGGKVHILGEVDEAATVSVAGQPARMTGARTFEADVDVAPGTNSIPIVSTDGSGNSRTQVYEVEVGGDAATFEHDENGNTTQKVSGGHTWTYQWNALNQLTAVSKDGQPVATFKYDALGRRIEKVAGGVTYRFVYSGQDILRETQSSGATYTYIHGPGIDEPLARLDQSGTAAYFHADGLGSIIAMTDAAGNVTSRRQYDAWGNLEVGADQPGYAFTGREWDPETGLYYYRARYYDPKIGRFISEDPIRFAAGVNFYAYVGNRPTVMTDALGLQMSPGYGTLPRPFSEPSRNPYLYFGASLQYGFGGVTVNVSPTGRVFIGPGGGFPESGFEGNVHIGTVNRSVCTAEDYDDFLEGASGGLSGYYGLGGGLALNPDGTTGTEGRGSEWVPALASARSRIAQRWNDFSN
ncbi:MAG: RHS repeat-associated core domain-containing protein [Vicinamibacteria bacterium]